MPDDTPPTKKQKCADSDIAIDKHRLKYLIDTLRSDLETESTKHQKVLKLLIAAEAQNRAFQNEVTDLKRKLLDCECSSPSDSE